MDAKFYATADQIISAYRKENLLWEHKPNETLLFSCNSAQTKSFTDHGMAHYHNLINSRALEMCHINK